MTTARRNGLWWLAVALGTMAERYLTTIPLKALAGLGFMAIGAWMIWDHLRL